MDKIELMSIIPSPFRNSLRKTYDYLCRTSLRRLLPLRDVTIETTSYCNLRCKGCYHTRYDYAAKNKHMKLEDFKMYVDQLKSTYTLILHGHGEPTLNPDLMGMIKYARDTKKFKKIHFTTNVLAKNPKIFNELFANGLYFINISVDSLNQEEVDQLRQGTSVGMLIKNIKYLVDNFSDKLDFRMVISKINYDTFQNTVKKLALCGVKSVGLSPYTISEGTTPCNYSDKKKGDESLICLSAEEKKEFLEKVENTEIEGINLNVNSMFNLPKTPCYSPYVAPVITVDGYLTPCCNILNENLFNFGNLKEKPFRKLFYSKEYSALQRAIIAGKYPFFCKGCILNHSEFVPSKLLPNKKNEME